ncbi:hypothetical protein EPI10_006757 [Gossypium australe]|uniref:Uncharacterized protein n=1 Tax=Gossypium australe TaxID=47621 RepID=A0A5B6WV79_9ROSI|nr:hypothetical protein EPI10_006757 [Gossypium australe]
MKQKKSGMVPKKKMVTWYPNLIGRGRARAVVTNCPKRNKNDAICYQTSRENITAVFLIGTQGTIKSQYLRMSKRKLLSRVLLALMLLKECNLTYATL